MTFHLIILTFFSLQLHDFFSFRIELFCEIKSELSCRLFVKDRLCLSSYSEKSNNRLLGKKQKTFCFKSSSCWLNHQPHSHIQPAHLNMLQNSEIYCWEYSQTAMSKCLPITKVLVVKKCNYVTTPHITTQHSFCASDCYWHERCMSL